MRKILLLTTVTLVALSATGCNCCRNRCGGGGGLFGGMMGHRQPMYAAAPQMCCPQPVAVECCDPCASTGTVMDGGMMGSAVMGSPMVSDGASCCN